MRTKRIYWRKQYFFTDGFRKVSKIARRCHGGTTAATWDVTRTWYLRQNHQPHLRHATAFYAHPVSPDSCLWCGCWCFWWLAADRRVLKTNVIKLLISALFQANQTDPQMSGRIIKKCLQNESNSLLPWPGGSSLQYLEISCEQAACSTGSRWMSARSSLVRRDIS